MVDSIVFAGIAPHPPLLVPEVGGSRIEQVADSRQALREFSRRLMDSRPDSVLVISPHSPLDPVYFTARSTPLLRGDFREFHAPQVSLSFSNDIELLDAIKQAAIDEGVAFRKLERNYPLDHGALVPLYYLEEAGWSGPVAVIGFSHRSNQDHVAFGRAIARGASYINRRVAIVASGDLSHRLIEGGPYEYEPTAHLFDEQIVAATARGDARTIIEVDHELRIRAGECGYRSIVMALGSVDCFLRNPQVLSYEGPFGVGYMVAVLADRGRF
ncbi:MAG TPA: class III extradiol dioxygenase subunit B-like domain-containing protein [Blastocatellia bacterium]|nr:class III extradiol dioxygenase subunit B-like domain-containing protein [Blastocatellia bacterium]